MNESRLIRRPTVEVLAMTVLASPVLGVGTDAERLIEHAARTCYQSHGSPASTSRGLHKGLRTSGHGSVWEHASATVELRGVTRWFTHELVRHRAGMSYSQMSTRYTDASQLRMVVPPRCPEGLVRELYEAHEAALDRYQEAQFRLVALPKARRHEVARAFLPANAETTIVVTGNLRAWLHFLGLRGALGAADEMRVVARAIWGALEPLAPMVLGHLAWTEDADGVPMLAREGEKE
jgi:thymidylate synthase (FAD)